MVYKELFRNPWLSLRETEDGYVYSHELRCGGAIEAVMPYSYGSSGTIVFAGRIEQCPSHDDGFALCALTGGAEGHAPLITAVHEVYEEAGLKVDYKNLVELGTVKPTKSSDTTVHLYCVEVPWSELTSTPPGDGSAGEKGAYCKWVSFQELVKCKDPLVHTMLLRMRHSGIPGKKHGDEHS